jgi:hypothetical protein
MFFVTILALAAATVSASPIETRAKTVTLPLKHVRNVSSIKNIVEKGKARIDKINGVSSLVARTASGSVTNEDVTYVAPVIIGGTTWSLIVDTGCKSRLESSQFLDK